MSTVNIRSEIHQIVSAIRSLDSVEDQHIRFVLDWIESGNEIFRIEKPATPDTHLVAYFAIASPEMDQILKESSYQTHPYVHAFCKKSHAKVSKERYVSK